MAYIFRSGLASLLASAVPAMADAPVKQSGSRGTLMGPALRVGDVPHALKFHVDGLGMMVGIEMGPPIRHETILSFGDDPGVLGITLFFDQTAQPPAAIAQSNGYDRTVVRVVDVAGTAARLRAAGFTPGEIRDVARGNRIMIAVDPDGYKFELVQATREPK